MSRQNYFHCFSRHPKGERVDLDFKDKGHFHVHFWLLDAITNRLIQSVIVNHEDCCSMSKFEMKYKSLRRSNEDWCFLFE